MERSTADRPASAAGTARRRIGTYLSIERTTDIAAPPARVFALVGDVARSPEWAGSGEVRGVEKLTDGPVRVGTRYRSSQKVRGIPYRIDSTVVAYEPDHLIVWEVGPLRHTWAFRVEPHGAGSRLYHSYDVDTPRSFPVRLGLKAGYRLGGRPAQIGRHLEATLDNIGRRVERPAEEAR